jgi:predicted RNA-binding protein with PUA-like domain
MARGVVVAGLPVEDAVLSRPNDLNFVPGAASGNGNWSGHGTYLASLNRQARSSLQTVRFDPSMQFHCSGPKEPAIVGIVTPYGLI